MRDCINFTFVYQLLRKESKLLLEHSKVLPIFFSNNNWVRRFHYIDTRLFFNQLALCI